MQAKVVITAKEKCLMHTQTHKKNLEWLDINMKSNLESTQEGHSNGTELPMTGMISSGIGWNKV